jgi:hypothetical protein
VELKKRALAGALSGLGGTVVLTALRRGLAKADLMNTSAPEQVVMRAEELRVMDDWSPRARQAFAVAAHFGYGIGAGTLFGALRHEEEAAIARNEQAEKLRGDKEGPLTEAAVGAALGVLSWGAGWAGWLPVAGVHPAPWTQKTPRALLPILDHAAYGAAWGLLFYALTRKLGGERP